MFRKKIIAQVPLSARRDRHGDRADGAREPAPPRRPGRVLADAEPAAADAAISASCATALRFALLLQETGSAQHRRARRHPSAPVPRLWCRRRRARSRPAERLPLLGLGAGRRARLHAAVLRVSELLCCAVARPGTGGPRVRVLPESECPCRSCREAGSIEERLSATAEHNAYVVHGERLDLAGVAPAHGSPAAGAVESACAGSATAPRRRARGRRSQAPARLAAGDRARGDELLDEARMRRRAPPPSHPRIRRAFERCARLPKRASVRYAQDSIVIPDSEAARSTMSAFGSRIALARSRTVDVSIVGAMRATTRRGARCSVGRFRRRRALLCTGMRPSFGVRRTGQAEVPLPRLVNARRLRRAWPTLGCLRR